MPATPADYIEGQPEPKRSELRALDALIRKVLPSFAPFLERGMIGYGPYHYRYASGREGDSFRVGLAANKTGISIYVCAVDEGGYLAEQARDRLGKASVGKSCIRVKRLADLDLGALTEVLRRARTATALGETEPSERDARTRPKPAEPRAKRPAAGTKPSASTKAKASAGVKASKVQASAKPRRAAGARRTRAV